LGEWLTARVGYYLGTVQIIWDEDPIEIEDNDIAMVYIAAATIVEMAREAYTPLGSVW
jgi:hypothetical protein